MDNVAYYRVPNREIKKNQLLTKIIDTKPIIKSQNNTIVVNF